MIAAISRIVHQKATAKEALKLLRKNETSLG